jgi:hypothetical protein
MLVRLMKLKDDIFGFISYACHVLHNSLYVRCVRLRADLARCILCLALTFRHSLYSHYNKIKVSAFL